MRPILVLWVEPFWTPWSFWITAQRSDCAILAYISCPLTIVYSSIAYAQVSFSLACTVTMLDLIGLTLQKPLLARRVLISKALSGQTCNSQQPVIHVLQQAG